MRSTSILLTFVGYAASQSIGHGQVKVWADPGFEGKEHTIQAGQDWDTYRSGFNDQISSIMVGDGVEVTLCADPGCANSGGHGSSVARGPINSSVMMDYNDNISYMKTRKVAPHEASVVTIF
jgi:hypothetical protein